MSLNPASALAWSLVAVIALGALAVALLRLKAELEILFLRLRLRYAQARNARQVKGLAQSFGCEPEQVQRLLDRPDFDEVLDRVNARLAALAAEQGVELAAAGKRRRGQAKVARTDKPSP